MLYSLPMVYAENSSPSLSVVRAPISSISSVFRHSPFCCRYSSVEWLEPDSETNRSDSETRVLKLGF